MGSLTVYLQSRFAELCPNGWQVRKEQSFLAPKLARQLGYAPRVDVLLERTDGSRRLWIEFEVSRADPVANHAKFATGYLFQPQPGTDAFVAMISAHVARGRYNLAANTTTLLRVLGIRAFQTALLPSCSAADIKQLNHQPTASLALHDTILQEEIERALAVSEALHRDDRHDVYFVGNRREVSLNLQYWNEAVRSPAGRLAWGKRTVTYFVYDPSSQGFAPSKFCAYLGLPRQGRSLSQNHAEQYPIAGLSLADYAALDQTTPLFDGSRARQHLIRHLGMSCLPLADCLDLQHAFQHWLQDYATVINIHPAGPMIIRPPV